MDYHFLRKDYHYFYGFIMYVDIGIELEGEFQPISY